MNSKWILLGIILQLQSSMMAYGDDVITVIIKKQESKDKYRWSLSDWLETRDKMRLQDLWLALHSPSPYEFYLDANYQIDQTSPQSGYNIGEVGFAAFNSIFGLESRYHFGIDRYWSGIFDLRIFGFHDQGTNITLQLGIRGSNRDDGHSYRNALTGGKITIYLARPFGIEGLYHHYFPSTPSSTGLSITGNRLQGGAFLEFKFLRFYGDYFTISETLASSSGFVLGSKLYF